jgi:hypothetical protein
MASLGVLAVQFIPFEDVAINEVRTGGPPTLAYPTATNKPLPKVTYSTLKPVGTVFQVIPSVE